MPITFEVSDDLAYWRAEVPGKVVAAAEALSGPTTPPGARVQLLNPPGSEMGPGQVAAWGKATANQVEAHGFQWNWAGKSSKHIPFDWIGRPGTLVWPAEVGAPRGVGPPSPSRGAVRGIQPFVRTGRQGRGCSRIAQVDRSKYASWKTPSENPALT